METKLRRIASIIKRNPKTKFTSLYHLINKELLIKCHKELDGKKATGVDRVTKQMYQANLEENIDNLVKRLKNKGYKPTPSLRVYIPKGNGKLRPLGISSYEDKIVQLALKKVLEPIFEAKFKDNMYGFRPNNGCHNAIKFVQNTIHKGKINYIVDADIKGFFDHVNHDWLLEMLKLNISDTNILNLINKYLKAGILDKGEYFETDEGTAQGNIISPLLANIYMHYVLVQWYNVVVKPNSKGETFLVVYADDFITGFQYEWEAKAYYEALKLRMAKFGLSLEESKSRLIEFGRFARQNRAKKGLGKPETFNFLGFTFYCGKTRDGRFSVQLKTNSKKFRQKLKDLKIWLYDNRTMRLKELIKMLNKKLIGHYQYYGVSSNSRMTANYLHRAKQLLFKVLNRRSSRKSYLWDTFLEMLKTYPLAKPKVYFSLYS